MTDTSKLPPHMQDAARRYVETGNITSQFLIAVLSNNLSQAVVKADDTNIAAMHDWVMWLHNEAPHACHGSQDAVANWIKAGGRNGINRDRIHTATTSRPDGCYSGHPSYDRPTGHGSWQRNG